MRPHHIRTSRATVLVSIAATIVAGCAVVSEGDADDFVFLVNTTDVVVDVAQEVTNGDQLVVVPIQKLEPGSRSVTPRGMFGRDGCIPGDLFARSLAGAVVDRTSTACGGQTWEIGQP